MDSKHVPISNKTSGALEKRWLYALLSFLVMVLIGMGSYVLNKFDARDLQNENSIKEAQGEIKHLKTDLEILKTDLLKQLSESNQRLAKIEATLDLINKGIR